MDHPVDVVSDRNRIGCFRHELKSLESLLGSDEVLSSSERLLRVVVLEGGERGEDGSLSVSRVETWEARAEKDEPA